MTDKLIKAITTTLAMLIVSYFSPESATAQTGPSFSMSPAGSTITPSSSTTLEIKMDTAGNDVTSYQAAVDVTGSNIPADLSLSVTAPSGMVVQHEDIIDITGGKQIQLAVTGSGNTGTVNNSNLTVGTVTFTAPASGQNVYTLDTSLSAIQVGSQGNILSGSFSETYTFESACTVTAPTVGSLSPNSGASYDEGQTVNLSASSINYGENCGSGSNSASLRYRTQGTSSWNTCDSGTGTSLSCALNPSPNTYEWNAVVSNGAENTTTTTRTFTVNEATVEDASLTFYIHLQAINNAANNQDITVTFKENTQPPSNVISSHTVTGTTGNHPSAGTNADLASVYDGTVTGITPGTYKVCFKAKGHLQACYYDVALQSGNNTKSFVNQNYDVTQPQTDEELLSGDVINDNILQLNDLTEVLTVYAQDERFRYDASGPTDPKDVNHDGFIDIADISLVLVNYTNLQIPGDE